MHLRVTQHRQYELGAMQAQRKYAAVTRLHQQISTGIRIARPSDDPAGIKIILQQKSIVHRADGQLESVSQSRSFLNQSSSQLLDLQQLLVRAKSLALEGRQALDQTERDTLASQLDVILGHAEHIANSQADGKFLFSGGATHTQPFSGVADGNFAYAGGPTTSPVSIGGDAGIKLYYSGQEVFQPPASGTLVIGGKTGVQPGQGTASGSNPTTLRVAHTLTTYSPGSGVQTGTNSAAGDTVIGQPGTHQLTIRDTSGTGAAGVVSLNGGPEIAFTSADTNLKVTGPEGEVVFIDTTSITAGFDGNVDLAASGTISIDGGVTSVPIDFSANQTLSNSALGVVQHFDTTGARVAGDVDVEYGENPNIFQALRQLRDDLRNVRGLNDTELGEKIGRRIQDLDAAQDHVLKIAGEQAVALQHLDSIETRLQDLKLGAQEVLGLTESTDYTSAIAKLQEEQNLLQFTYSTLAQLTNTSILDFLQ